MFDHHIKRELYYLEKVFIRNNNFSKWIVKYTITNTTTNLTIVEPSTITSALVCLPYKGN